MKEVSMENQNYCVDCESFWKCGRGELSPFCPSCQPKNLRTCTLCSKKYKYWNGSRSDFKEKYCSKECSDGSYWGEHLEKEVVK